MSGSPTGMATRDPEVVVSGEKTGRGGRPEVKGATGGRECVEETKGPTGTTSGHGDRTERSSEPSNFFVQTACQNFY